MENEIYCYGCMRPLDRERSVCPFCGYDNSISQNGEDLLPEGTVLSGKYLVGKRLGRGGFGVTYLGYDLALKKVIAIKEFFPMGLSTRSMQSGRVVSTSGSKVRQGFSKGLSAFLEEAQTLALFDDRGSIVHVRDYLSENGTAYIIMNYIRGKDLATEIAECGRIPWQRVMELFNPLILEMDLLHKNHLIHRDIKPANIKVVPATDRKPEHLVLMDFGSARSYISENVTGTYTAMLTPGYAPIEQYSSQSRQGPFTDVYGICATMYHAITGEIPPVVTDIVTGETELKSFADFGLNVPETVEKAVLLGLTVSPAKRTATMQDLYDQLNGLKPLPDPGVTVNPYLKEEDPENVPDGGLPVKGELQTELSEVPAVSKNDQPITPSRNASGTKSSGTKEPKPQGTGPNTEKPAPLKNEEGKKKNRILPILLALAVIIAVVLFLILKPNPPVPETSTSIPTITDTAEPLPTDTPEPTDEPATNTPEPTEEPATDTPEPTEEPATDTPEPTETASPEELYAQGRAAYEEANFADAFSCLVPAADAGDGDAQALLGYMYEYGTGLDEPDYDAAMKYYQLAADQGNAEGQTRLGQMYEFGTGMDAPDYDAAMKYFQMAADQGYADAQTDLAWMYFYGEGLDEPDYETAFSYYQMAADQGYARAQSWLAFMYEKGYGLDEPDLDMAEQYYQMAADQGYTTASVSLIALRRRGTEEALTATAIITDTPTPTATGTATLTPTPTATAKATATPTPTATATATATSTLRPTSTATAALTPTSTATAAGSDILQIFTPDQLYTLGRAAYDREEYDSAYGYLIPAADAGNADAQFRLAYMYEHGNGLDEPDYPNALKYYQMAAEQGHNTAQNNLGCMYREGYGMDGSNYSMALYYFRLAADQGNDYAMRNLAYMYERGEGMDQPDYEKAEYYYQMAVDHGNTSAASDLENLRKKMAEAAATPDPNVEYAVVQVEGDYGVLMRTAPSYSGSVMQAVLNGGSLEITGDAVSTEGINWFPVRTVTGVEGWVPESALVRSGSDAGDDAGLSDLHPGDVITFGHYEQDNDLSNGPEAIEWQVLTVEDGRALLISLYGLDAVKYNETRDSVTWETCSLRPWLNGTFFSTAFSSAEAARIAVTTVHTPMFRSIDGGNDTQDRLFLLSVSEMNAYFSGADSLKLTATDYAAGNGASVNADNGNTWWWLRTPWGEVTESAVSYEGSLWSVGLWVDMDFVTVRPAFWLNL